MRDLTYYVAVSLDGRIADPDGGFADFLLEGDHLPALVERFRETIPGHLLDAFGLEPRAELVDTVVMGWSTYAVGLPEGVTSPYPHLRQVVVTREHADVDVPAEVELTGEDPVAVVRRLKAESERGVWLCGGGRLASAVASEIDRLVLKVNPVLLGAGVPVVADAAYDPTRFDLERATPYDSGVVVLEYTRRAA